MSTGTGAARGVAGTSAGRSSGAGVAPAAWSLSWSRSLPGKQTVLTDDAWCVRWVLRLACCAPSPQGRNRRCVTINLNVPEGRDLVKR